MAVAPQRRRRRSDIEFSPMDYLPGKVLMFHKNIGFANLKSIAARSIGMVLATLLKLPIYRWFATWARLRFPKSWGALVKKIKPFYWAYKTSTSNISRDMFFKNSSTFNQQDWLEKQRRKRGYQTYLPQSGIMNNNPTVDPVALLKRVDEALHRQRATSSLDAQ